MTKMAGGKMNPQFVAELSINHLGMVNICKEMIHAAHEAGADYIKLKYKNVSKYYKQNQNKSWRNFNFQEYRASLELSQEDFTEIDQFCKNKDIKWFCTVHDEEGLDFIKEFNPPFYKIASMDSGKSELVEQVQDLCHQEDKPLIISIGGKNDEFTDKLVSEIKDKKLKAYILHTVSIYPTPVGNSNVGYIKKLINKYQDDNIKIGYSGHEQGYAASILACMFGANLVERHFTLSRDLEIHHIDCALTPPEYKKMISLIQEMSEELSSNFDDGFSAEELKFLQNREYK